MERFLVVSQKKDWPWTIPGVVVIDAKSYLSDRSYFDRRRARIYNLCRSYRYQSLGYYVSLLASARKHQARPSVMALLDIKSRSFLRLWSEEFDRQIQRNLKDIQAQDFTLSIYFGRNLAKKYDSICRLILEAFEAPLLRAEFVRKEAWELNRIRPIPLSEVPEIHRDFLLESAKEYFLSRKSSGTRTDFTSRYDLGILVNPDEENPPSDEVALKKFKKAGERIGFSVEFITKEDFSRIPEFDALFIRETTAVNHHTYRFARRAAAEGLIVLDDPDSILKCTNKVYLAELLMKRGIRCPKTWILHRDNLEEVSKIIPMPAILKQPDGSFSSGVSKADTREEFLDLAQAYLEDSDLVLAQEFLKTDYDWRVGILDQRVLYVCRYHMAKNHWQIIENQGEKRNYGRVEAIDPSHAPAHVIETALAATMAMGKGLYGVDLKEKNNEAYIIEINDNPTIEAGYEDKFSKDSLYTNILQVFADRIELERRRRSL